MFEVLERSFWAFAVRGVFAIAFGIIVLAWPTSSLLALAILFGIFGLADGTVSLIEMVSDDVGARGVVALRGVLGLLAGLFALTWPGLTSVILIFVIAFWAIAVGALEVVHGISPPRGEPRHWGIVVAGVVTLVLGIAILGHPAAGALAVMNVIGIVSIVRGCALIAMGFNVRRLKGKLARPS